MSRPGHIWFTTFAVIGALSGTIAAVLLWLIVTRPFIVVRAVAGLP